jgi:hypothetical protein
MSGTALGGRYESDANRVRCARSTRQVPDFSTALPAPALMAVGQSRAHQFAIESGDVSTQDALNFIVALGGTLKLVAGFGDEQLKIA